MKNVKLIDREFLNSKDFKAQTLSINISRGKILAFIIILLELALSLINIIASVLKVDNRFQFNGYLAMYAIMIAVNIIFIIWAGTVKDLHEKSFRQIRRIERIVIVYITFFMSWGSIVSLMDQELYAELTAFMISVLSCAVIYNLNAKALAVPFAASASIILIGLPFVQQSSDVLVGHYVNLSLYLIISWVASRIVFNSQYKQYVNTLQLNKSKALLEAETRINVRNNAKLKEMNLHLKKLSMFDELTRLPNRRSFRDYIDYHFENPKDNLTGFSVIMIDVDRFKQLNDKYGHSIGDIVLKRIANQISSSINIQTDFAARWGGDEFIFASFNKSEKEISKIADTIRNRILSLNTDAESPLETPNISISLGTCTMDFTGHDIVGKCIENADKALYSAKTSGRNCVKNYM